MSLDVDARTSVHGTAGHTGDAATAVSGFTYRALVSAEDAAACVALQGDIWGSEFDKVPGSLLRVAAKIGGLTIGAFDERGTLVGFVFGLAGVRDGHLIHWSHMLGVREDVRGFGVGRHLKEVQRAELARRGVARVLWTFDPLQARNAHLNFNRLGVRLVEYVENMYGITASPLHHGLATDRLVVMLSTVPGAEQPVVPAVNGAAPVLTPFPRAGDVIADADRLDDASAIPPATLSIEVPTDLNHLTATAPGMAERWRIATRQGFLHALRRGYEVVGLRRDLTTDRAFYTLAAPSGGAATTRRDS